MPPIPRVRGSRQLDLHLGLRVRARRKEAGLSLEALATDLGIAYQQVQKYETGANRISASTLYEIARALRTPVTYFYAGLPSAGEHSVGFSAAARIDAVLATPGGRELVDAYLSMPRQLRQPFVALARGVANDDSLPETPQAIRLPTWR
ncbi:MAG: helix-turn-helix transcriptional regulator [Phenylobacterium sp.]|uniref:helix-turn-helix domain-containing protein n=1 Tax=Phenylobacterium sp. TaxID=1871053 RepID=UPI002735D9C5|nr:helix-turn-helix transcriptional regulator [Phenylobacterium sp.]MDP3749288.1 helix-turn-helix transcriptional regulator [Phenylobacterium sp.]